MQHGEYTRDYKAKSRDYITVLLNLRKSGKRTREYLDITHVKWGIIIRALRNKELIDMDNKLTPKGELFIKIIYSIL